MAASSMALRSTGLKPLTVGPTREEKKKIVKKKSVEWWLVGTRTFAQVLLEDDVAVVFAVANVQLVPVARDFVQRHAARSLFAVLLVFAGRLQEAQANVDEKKKLSKKNFFWRKIFLASSCLAVLRHRSWPHPQ